MPRAQIYAAILVCLASQGQAVGGGKTLRLPLKSSLAPRNFYLVSSLSIQDTHERQIPFSSIQGYKMPQHTTPRQPLSCENCRKRKIKCPSGPAPCLTCVRRGHSDTCYYKRNANNTQQASANENELLYRIRNLEDLLKQQIAQSSQSPPEPRLGSTPTRSDDASSSEGSVKTALRTKALQTGTIFRSAAGYEHFVPRASTLGVNLVHELVESVPSPSSASNFPFSSDPISVRSTLLDMLPPLRQCDELERVYFEVFSPVSCKSPIEEKSNISIAIPRSP